MTTGIVCYRGWDVNFGPRSVETGKESIVEGREETPLASWKWEGKKMGAAGIGWIRVAVWECHLADRRQLDMYLFWPLGLPALSIKSSGDGRHGGAAAADDWF